MNRKLKNWIRLWQVNLAATPDAVPTPFDPSILWGERESVHMKDGDIVNFLKNIT